VSSTILYLAIVAIWAGVLVPRWLRREPHREATAASPRVTPGQSEPADGSAAGGSPGAPGLSVSASVVADGAGLAGYGAEEGPRGARRSGGVMAARRRLFGVLVLLFATAVVIAISGLASWWVVVPPSGMLAGFMMLLREAARADAERNSANVRRGGSMTRSGHGAAAGPLIQPGAGRAASPQHAPGHAASAHAAAPRDTGGRPAARVIDLTAHVGDELYDQDTDAKLRAVGD
jgi:hypothetical protein